MWQVTVLDLAGACTDKGNQFFLITNKNNRAKLFIFLTTENFFFCSDVLSEFFHLGIFGSRQASALQEAVNWDIGPSHEIRVALFPNTDNCV